MSADLRVKHSLSRHHFRTAKYFWQACAQIEASCETLSAADSIRHRAYVTGTILFSVAAIEASINELLLKAIDKNKGKLPGLTDASLSELARAWQREENLSLFKKYQKILCAVGAKELDKEDQLSQAVHSLVKLRDALVHYKPEWDYQAELHKELESRLAGRFPLNRFASAGSLWFPHKCLGAGCAKWAVETIQEFMSEFCKKMGIPDRF